MTNILVEIYIFFLVFDRLSLSGASNIIYLACQYRCGPAGLNTNSLSPDLPHLPR